MDESRICRYGAPFKTETKVVSVGGAGPLWVAAETPVGPVFSACAVPFEEPASVDPAPVGITIGPRAIDLAEADLVAEVTRRALAGTLSEAAVDVLVALRGPRVSMSSSKSTTRGTNRATRTRTGTRTGGADES